MIQLVMLANLVAYALVAGQPLAYLVFLSSAQRALSAPAYIELRQHINPVMTRRVPVIYVAALVTGLMLLVLALRSRDGSVLATTTVALLCLVADVVLMLRENVPINGVMDRWSTSTYPDDWEAYRTKWFTVFGYRQVVLLVGFLSLLVGAVFG